MRADPDADDTWYCFGCDAFLPLGEDHLCPADIKNQGTKALQQIAQELHRIANALEGRR